MMRLSRLWAVSAKWSLCSSQLQTFLAESGGDAGSKPLQAARNFLRDTDVSRVVEETDDALELLYYMQRVDYPKQSRLEEAAREWFAEHSHEFQATHLKLVCRYITERAAAIAKAAAASSAATASSADGFLPTLTKSPHGLATELWSRTLLQGSWLRSRLPQLLESMDLCDTLLLAKVHEWTRDANKAAQLSPTPSTPSGSGGAALVPPSDFSAVVAVIAARCKSLLGHYVVKSSRAGGKTQKTDVSVSDTTFKLAANPLPVDALLDVVLLVLPHDANRSVLALLQPHLERLTLEDSSRVVVAALSQPHTSMILVVDILQHMTVELGRSALPAALVVQAAVDTTNAVLSRLNHAKTAKRGDAGSMAGLHGEFDALEKSTEQFVTAVVQRLDLTDCDEDSVAPFGDTLSSWEKVASCTYRSRPGDLLLEKTKSWAPLHFFFACVLGRHEVLLHVFPQLRGVVGSLGFSQATHIIHGLRALAIERDDASNCDGAHDRPTSPRCVFSALNLPALTEIVTAASKVLLADRLSLTAKDAAALLLVVATIDEELQLHAHASGIPKEERNIERVVDDLVQRLVHSTKLTRSSTHSVMSSGGSSTTSWTLPLVRTVVLGLSLVGYAASRQVALAEQIQSVFLTEWQRHMSAASYSQPAASSHLGEALTLKQSTSLLVALNDIQLLQGVASRFVIHSVLQSAPQGSVEDVVHCITALSVLNVRDVHVISSLFRELCSRDGVTALQVVRVADAARRLRLVQQFQQSGLTSRVLSLVSAAVSTRAPLEAPDAQAPAQKVKQSSKTKAQATNAAIPSTPFASYLSLEQFSILLAASSAEEQQRLFALLETFRTTVTPDTSLSATERTASALLSLREAYESQLSAYLVKHPSVSLMLLGCKECPTGFKTVLSHFVLTAQPLTLDAADPEALLGAVAVIESAVVERKKRREAAASLAPASSVSAEDLFASLCTFGVQAVLQMSEPSLMTMVQTALQLDSVSNSVFRSIGRRIAVLADGLTPENALSCLSLYAKYRVRDDRVVKSLLTRCIFTIGSIGNSPDLSATLRRVCEAYPHWSTSALQALQKYSSVKARRERRMN